MIFFCKLIPFNTFKRDSRAQWGPYTPDNRRLLGSHLTNGSLGSVSLSLNAGKSSGVVTTSQKGVIHNPLSTVPSSFSKVFSSQDLIYGARGGRVVSMRPSVLPPHIACALATPLPSKSIVSPVSKVFRKFSILFFEFFSKRLSDNQSPYMSFFTLLNEATLRSLSFEPILFPNALEKFVRNFACIQKGRSALPEWASVDTGRSYPFDTFQTDVYCSFLNPKHTISVLFSGFFRTVTSSSLGGLKTKVKQLPVFGVFQYDFSEDKKKGVVIASFSGSSVESYMSFYDQKQVASFDPSSQLMRSSVDLVFPVSELKSAVFGCSIFSKEASSRSQLKALSLNSTHAALGLSVASPYHSDHPQFESHKEDLQRRQHPAYHAHVRRTDKRTSARNVDIPSDSSSGSGSGSGFVRMGEGALLSSESLVSPGDESDTVRGTLGALPFKGLGSLQREAQASIV